MNKKYILHNSWFAKFLLILSLFYLHSNKILVAESSVTASNSSYENPLLLLNIEPLLFELQAIEFASGNNILMQQEYLFKEALANAEQPGLLLFNLMQYTKKIDESSLPPEKQLKWRSLNRQLSNVNAEQQLIFMSFYILQFFPDIADEYKTEFLTASANEQSGCWIKLLNALVALQISQSNALHLLPKDYNIENMLRKASVQANTDALFHLALGNFYWHFLKNEENPYKRMRLVVQEYEKSRTREPTNRGLFTTITGKYIALHQEFQENDILEPFEFEELLYTRIIMLEPRNPWAHNNLAFLYCQNNVRLNEAIKQATIANQLEMDNPYFLDTLGWCLYRHKRYPESLSVLTRAIEINPELAEIHFHLASLYYDQGHLELAAEGFQNCLNLEPDHALSMNNLAYLYAEMEINLDEALSLSLRATELSPDNSAFLDTAGWIYFKKESYAEALPYLQKAAELDENSWETQMHLGLVYQKLGLSEKADFCLQKAAELSPKTTETTLMPSVVSNDANQILVNYINEAKKKYLSLPNSTKDINNIKIFYDLQIYLAQQRGDTKLIQELAQELGNLPSTAQPSVNQSRPVSQPKSISQPAVNQSKSVSQPVVNPSKSTSQATSPTLSTKKVDDENERILNIILAQWKQVISDCKSFSPIIDPDRLTIDRFFPAEPELYITIDDVFLRNFLRLVLSHLSLFVELLPVPNFLDLIDAALPKQIAIFSGIFAPLKSNHLYAVLEFSSEQINIMRSNIQLLDGHDIVLPYQQGEATIVAIDTNNYSVQINEMNFFVSIYETFVFVAPNLLFAARLPLPFKQSLASNEAIQKQLLPTGLSGFAAMYIRDLAEYYKLYVSQEELQQLFSDDDAELIQSILNGIQQYLCLFQLSSNQVLTEHETLGFRSAENLNNFYNLSQREGLDSLFGNELPIVNFGIKTDIIQIEALELNTFTVIKNFSDLIFHLLQKTISFPDLLQDILPCGETP